MEFLKSDHLSDPSLSDIDSQRVGTKALDLREIPIDWVPPYFVVPSECYVEWIEAGKPDPASTPDILPEGELEPAVRETLTYWNDEHQFQKRFGEENDELEFIVRSSAVTESLLDRGVFKSTVCQAKTADVRTSIFEIWSDAADTMDSLDSSPVMGVIVQPKIPTVGAGHLSNERRVSRKSTDWSIEWEIEPGQLDDPKLRFSTLAETPIEPSEVLTAGSPADVQQSLKQVATWLRDDDYRCHVEWVWDGDTLWLVQIDFEHTNEKPGPTSEWQYEFPSDFEPYFEILSTARKAGDDWDKTYCLNVFDACSLYCPNIYLLRGDKLESNLNSDRLSAQLESEVRDLMQAPIVVRSDVKAPESESVEVFSPRSETLTQASDVIDFLTKKFEEFQDRGYNSSEFCFLIHLFLVSKASALANASPVNPMVLIDGIWGLPDGLNHYRHDTFQVNSDTEEVIYRDVRCKQRYLDVTSEGEWVERTAGKPWDWKASITDDQLVSIATKARKIAEHQGEPVIVMFFVDLGIETLSGDSIPWFFWTPSDSAGEISTTARDWSRTTITVRVENDLHRIRERADELVDSDEHAIRFVPTPDNIRNTSFVEQLADLAAELGIPVQLEGSILSHVNYIMERSDAQLQTNFDLAPSNYSRRFSKLVRDNIPVLIESGGEEAHTYQVPSEDIVDLLKSKAVEEALEFGFTETPEDEIEELADLLEIIRTYNELRGFTMEDIRAIADEKRETKGGFEEGIVLVSTLDSRVGKQKSDPDNQATSQPHLPTPLFPESQIQDDLLPRKKQPEEETKSIEVPLVPPHLRGADKTTKYEFQELGLTINLQYMEDNVLLQISPKEKSEDSATQQTELGDYTQ